MLLQKTHQCAEEPFHQELNLGLSAFVQASSFLATIISHTLNIALVVRLTTNTRTTDTAHRLTAFLRSGSKTKHALDGLHDAVGVK